MDDDRLVLLIAALSGVGTVVAAATVVGTAPLLLALAVVLGLGEAVLVHVVLTRAFAYAEQE